MSTYVGVLLRQFEEHLGPSLGIQEARVGRLHHLLYGPCATSQRRHDEHPKVAMKLDSSIVISVSEVNAASAIFP
jgi:hypothetical protein